MRWASAWATFSSQNLGAGRRQPHLAERQGALAIYFVWWVFVMAFTFLLGGAAIRGITGSTDEVIISKRAAVPENQRTGHPADGRAGHSAQHAAGHPAHGRAAAGQRAGACGKVIFAVWLVPVRGYRAVCFCEPTTWVVCFVFILLAVWRCRGDLRDAEKNMIFFAKRACNLEVVLL